MQRRVFLLWNPFTGNGTSSDYDGECFLNVNNLKDGEKYYLKQKISDHTEAYEVDDKSDTVDKQVTLFSVGFSNQPQLIHFSENKRRKIDYSDTEYDSSSIEAAVGQQFSSSVSEASSEITEPSPTKPKATEKKANKRRGSCAEGFTWYECSNIEDCEEQIKQHCESNGFTYKTEFDEILHQEDISWAQKSHETFWEAEHNNQYWYPFNSTPFWIIGKRDYKCSEMDTKTSCEAKIFIKQIITFPDIQTKNKEDLSCLEEYKALCEEVDEYLKGYHQVELKYFIGIPEISVHNHMKLNQISIVGAPESKIRKICNKDDGFVVVWPCPVCDKKFKALSCTKRHIYSHIRTHMHFCVICSKSFMRPEQVRNHARVHHPDKEAPLCVGERDHTDEVFQMPINEVRIPRSEVYKDSCHMIVTHDDLKNPKQRKRRETNASGIGVDEGQSEVAEAVLQVERATDNEYLAEIYECLHCRFRDQSFTAVQNHECKAQTN
ncbi:DgyrCDS4026 [Dimorphilus gyrociliatus]|uniref:DgyrCDS4026 n=1 Tax=Dimorphilus gyrociliatus TaxID=2664684 RepID=A0A7I8VHU4_9ANNE|nr:DgyrCDS4026 [Dimorphilus gyrociliatus]